MNIQQFNSIVGGVNGGIIDDKWRLQRWQFDFRARSSSRHVQRDGILTVCHA